MFGVTPDGQRLEGADRDHRLERNHPRARVNRRSGHGRLVADLRRRPLRRDDQLREDPRARPERAHHLDVHAAGRRRLGGVGPDHERLAGGGSRQGARLRRLARRRRPQAQPGRRIGGDRRRLAGHDHPRPDPREGRDGAQHLGRSRAGDDRRLHRRRAALPGPRRLDRPGERGRSSTSGTRCARTGTRSSTRPRCPDSDSAIWARGRRGRRARHRPHPGRDRERAVRREDRMGRQRARALTRRGRARRELDAAQPGRSSTPATSTSARLRRRSCAVPTDGSTASRAGRTHSCALIDIERMQVVQTLPTPGAQSMFTAPAVLGRNVFIATAAGTAAYRLTGSGTPRLLNTWPNDTAGTSPVIAGGLVYVYDPTGGGINIYRPGSPDPVARCPRRPVTGRARSRSTAACWSARATRTSIRHRGRSA